MLNGIWLGLVLSAIVFAAFNGTMPAVTDAIFTSARTGVDLAIGLVGAMMFLLGAMRVAFDGGLRDWIGTLIAPLLRRLFPEVPADHPAMSSMVMNIASNVLGLGNAATPFGLKAMSELQRLNPNGAAASDAMVLFLAINTSAVTLLPPLGTIGVRLAAGSEQPEVIWLPTLIATACSTTAAISAYFLLRRLPAFAPRLNESEGDQAADSSAGDGELAVEVEETSPDHPAAGPGARWVALGAALLLAVAFGRDLFARTAAPAAGAGIVQDWLFPTLIAGLMIVGLRSGVRAYESAVEGAKEGLEVAGRIVPYLVVILVAVGMFRASGALGRIIQVLDPMTSAIGVPAEVLPMALLRPLSGSGAFGVMSEILTANGPDSFVGLLASTLQGSTETTFYVLALYLGAAGVTDGRHTLAACLIGDLAGFVGAVVACHIFFGA